VSRTEVSAGGVVFRDGPEGVEIILVRRHAERLVAIPKGKVDPGESLPETAAREVREETGLKADVVAELGTVEYWFTDFHGERVEKIVHYYLMAPTGGDIADHDDEFDEVGWFHIAEAQRILTHQNQMHILHRAAELIAKMPA
jgi:8-oxo-dGTP pyrophosphatase MutT (NUDIX family)